MRKTIISSALICGFLTMVAVTTANAQFPNSALRATIPFDFIVRGKALPAGEYEIKRIHDSPEALVIANLNNHEQAIFETEPVEVARSLRRSELVFHRYNDSYFLAEVLDAWQQAGSELAPTRAERNLRREVASNKTEPETVTLAVY